MELYATIRKTSKYAHQGTEAGTGKPILFPVRARPGTIAAGICSC